MLNGELVQRCPPDLCKTHHKLVLMLVTSSVYWRFASAFISVTEFNIHARVHLPAQMSILRY